MPSGYPPPDKVLRDWLLSLDIMIKTKPRRGSAASPTHFFVSGKLKLFEGSVIAYNYSDQNLIVARIPQGPGTSLVGHHSTSLKFKSDSVNWRFVSAAA